MADHERPPRMSGSMIAEVVPTRVASAELFRDPPDVVLFEAELASVANAVETRRREFGTVRHRARLSASSAIRQFRSCRGNGVSPCGLQASWGA
jgi:hypothetical protein